MSFIRGLPDSPADRAIVAAMATVTRELGCDCIAEGVETDQQLRALRALGVNRVQGYLTGRPMEAAALAGHLAATDPAAAPAPRLTSRAIPD